MSAETLAERLVQQIIEQALATGGVRPPNPPEPEQEAQQ